MPPETVSEVENLKGEYAPRPPGLSKLMSAIISLADQKSSVKHLKYFYSPHSPLTQQLSHLLPSPPMKILNEAVNDSRDNMYTESGYSFTVVRKYTIFTML